MKTPSRLLLAAGLLLALAATTWAQSSPTGVNAGNATGTQPYVTYGGVRENINLTNGNLNLQVPLLTLPGRNGLDLGIGLEYDSKIWQVHEEFVPEFGTYWYWWDAEERVPGIGVIGWNLSVPALHTTWRKVSPTPTSNIYCYMDFVVTLSDGSKHSFKNSANCHTLVNNNMSPSPSSDVPVADSTDASFSRLDTSNLSNVILYLKDGTRIHFFTNLLPGGNEGESFPYSKVADKVVDSDGNMITIQQQGAPVSSITDTLGRVVTFTWTNLRLTSIRYKDSQGVDQYINLEYVSHELDATFAQPPGSIGVSGPIQVLDTITLPNGLSYTFEYDNHPQSTDAYAEVTKIKYPTGGYTAYGYGTFTNQIFGMQTGSDSREVTARRVCRDQGGFCGTEDVTTYTASTDGSGYRFVDVHDPEGNRTQHKFSPAANLPGNRDFSPRELFRWVYAGESTLLRTIQTDYEPINSQTGWPETWSLPKTITTTLNDNGSNQVTKTEYTYDTYTHLPDNVSRIIDNPTEVREYAFGTGAAGALVRKTVNTWVKTNPINGQNYHSNAIHIMDRKASEKVYDAAGALKAQTDFEYDSYTEGLTASGTVQHESSFGTSYTTRGNLTAVMRWRNTPAATLTSRNQYDDAGNLRKTTDPLSHNTTFSYTDAWANSVCTPVGGSAKAYLTSATNHLSQSTTSTYNSCSGTAATTTDPNLRTSSFTYDVMGRLTQTDLPDTGQALTSYSEAAMPLSVTRTVKINASMNAVAPTDVDGLGRVTFTKVTSDPGGTVYTKTEYDSLGRKKRVYNPTRCFPVETNCGESTWGYTDFEYDALGRVTKVIPPDGSGTANNVSSTYTGNCTIVTDQAGKKRKSCTDALGRLIEVWEPDASGAFVYQTVYTYDVLDNLLTVVQSGSRNRSFAYNSLSQLTSATNPESGTITYTYDNDGNLLTKTAPKPNQTGSLTVTTTYTYDALHRLLTKSYNDGSTPAVNYYYDGQNPAGSPATPGSGSVGISGTLQSSTSNPTPGTGWVDINGEVQDTEIDPCSDQGMWPPCPQTVYDSGTVWITVNGVTKSVSYNQSSTNLTIATALRSAINADGSYPVTAGGSGNRVTLTAKTSGSGTNYSLSAGSTYNTMYFFTPSFTTTKSGNNLTGGSDGSTTYDAGNVWITVNGLQKTVSYSQSGNSTATAVATALRSAINGDTGYPVSAGGTGTTVTLTAKTSGSSTNYSLSAGSSSSAGFSPPSFSATPSGSSLTGGADATTGCTPTLTITNGTGRRTGMCDAAGGEAWSYDPLGRVLTNVRRTNNQTKSFTYTYNLDGSLKTLTYPSGHVVTYTPNAAGQTVSAVGTGGVNYVVNATYAPHGALSGRQNGASLVSAFYYTNRLQPCRISVKSSGTAPNQCTDMANVGNVLDFTYDFDSEPAAGVQNNGNVGRIINNVNNARTQSFSYDELNRLKTAQTQATTGSLCWAEVYTYDIWANLYNISGMGSHGSCTQGLLSVTALSNNRLSGFSYDAAGNMTDYPGLGSYTYDAENRMKTTAGVTYTYDGDGRRVMKSNGKLYWYGAGSSVLMETDLSGNLQDEYIFFNGQRVARRTSAGVVFYFFSDHLGSNRVVTNASGGVVEDSDFFPFGAERVVTDSLNNNYKFTGHERDAEAGLDFMVARHYAFTLGRFLQPDTPFADQSPSNPQTWNLYSYARNNPLYFVDPSGRSGCPWSPCGMSAGGTLPAKQDLGIFGSRSEYDNSPGIMFGWSDNVPTFGSVNSESDQNTTTSEQVEQNASGVTAPLGEAGQRAQQSTNVALDWLGMSISEALISQRSANFFQGAGDVFILPAVVNWATGASGVVNRSSGSYWGGVGIGTAVALPLGAYTAATRGPQGVRAAFAQGGRLNTGRIRLGWSKFEGERVFSLRFGSAHLDLTGKTAGAAIVDFGRRLWPVIKNWWDKLQ